MLPLSENELDELIIRERERGERPLTEWASLSTALREEGLIRDPARSLFGGSQPWLRVAAAVALLAGGAAIGRYSARGSEKSAANVGATAAATSQTSGSSAELASNAPATTFRSADEAWSVLNRAGEEYQRASAYLSANNNEVPMPSSPSMYRTRLAALDNVMTEMRAALHEAPQDPVINQYYLATVGAREATLKQLGTTLPPGTRLDRF